MPLTHDGQNLFDPGLAFGGNEWKVDEAFDTAVAGDGSIREAIVVGIGNSADRIYELTPTPGTRMGGGADRYLAMVVDEIKPLVDGMLRTKGGRDDTAIAGSSLGGLVSAYAGVKRPDVFGLVGVFSPSTWWDNKVIVGQVAATKGRPRPLKLYLDAGTDGDGLDDTKLLLQAYRDSGFTEGRDLQFVIQTGGRHSEVYWAQRFPGAMRFLLGPR